MSTTFTKKSPGKGEQGLRVHHDWLDRKPGRGRGARGMCRFLGIVVITVIMTIMVIMMIIMIIMIMVIMVIMVILMIMVIMAYL